VQLLTAVSAFFTPTYAVLVVASVVYFVAESAPLADITVLSSTDFTVF